MGDKRPIREYTEIFLEKEGRTKVGTVTSGTQSPSLKKAIGIAYVDTPSHKINKKLWAKVRNKMEPITIKKMPFVKNNYYVKPK